MLSMAWGGGTNYDVFTLGEVLANNAYKDFTVKSSSFRVIGFRGNNTLGTVIFGFANAETFGSGVYGWHGTDSTNGGSLISVDYFFTFPNPTTMRFTNKTGSDLSANTRIFIIYD